jgi:hypothetical protein
MRNELAERIEAPEPLAVADREKIVAMLVDAFPDLGADASFDGAMVASAAESADVAIHLAEEALSFWDLRLRGKTNAEDGHWTCTLRRSSSDADVALAIGRSPALARAVLSALVRVTERLDRPG